MNNFLLRLNGVRSSISRSFCSLSASSATETSTKNCATNNQLDAGDPDAPIQMPNNPYTRSAEKCILCRHNVKLEYKNTRLLQQFVSSFSGRVYEQHITGLCTRQYRTLLKTIKLSRKAGYMPVLTKDPKYLRDPKLFDPMRPIRPHSFE